ncbi:hypothetical protein [Sphingobacterium multivorum]|uniref:HK97 gp10 family phage protein n=1 Tax=Sphingobacterium multivorum TaxID=28454 RepID=A0A654D070_SPHMU|nr:hypothetical protein [Sphingobacterium multivorum]VXC99229.1 conserved hypothetical protein [Sphingobacterium multivorum]
MAIKGLKGAQNMINGKVKKYRKGIRDLVRTTGEHIQSASKLGAPPMIDNLIHGQIVSNQNGYGYVVQVNEMPGAGLMRNMPVYLEFGTGLYAANYVKTLPLEWQKAALKYYINGKGSTKTHAYLQPAWVTATSGFVEKVKGVLRS